MYRLPRLPFWALCTGLGCTALTAAPVASIKYAPVAAWSAGEERLFQGESTLLASVEMDLVTVAAGQTMPGTTNQESLWLVQRGEFLVELGDDAERVVGPGSIVLVMPGDACRLTNHGDESGTVYRLRYQSKAPVNRARGGEGGGSLVVDFGALEFQPHDRGGLRSYFDRPTAMTSNFEMHVTTLNRGITSHPPHTHTAEEIILMIHGEAEELINGEPYALKTGELVFLDAMVPHGIRNTGDGTCMYFAFQWR
ncbi:cupin domain-containing protein [Synoicihabitans lomoniglobus]|uniref:Cupin domain-containing protein n=1 Tax=Synoicihabitans lomoniglobus TaxID=2909285 RepID=A0AAE9ZT29_9BACT|nr:cupin domain-containing protein [Opitutaceae bacterium LMO-M01]WED63627.1 cupin domain-containing protein [Opitutaceae bacterium LMO-M01]